MKSDVQCVSRNRTLTTRTGARSAVGPVCAVTVSSPTLSWNAPSTGTTPFAYEVVLAVDAGFTSTIGAGSNLSSTS